MEINIKQRKSKVRKLTVDKSCKKNVQIEILAISKPFTLSKVYEASLNSLGSY